VHGIDYNSNGIYDNVLDRSDLNRSLTGESTAPALCGKLRATKTTGTTTASTHRRAVTTYAIVWQRESEPAWLCHPLATASA
jgi:hypothetical protein